jgi:carboxylesterase
MTDEKPRLYTDPLHQSWSIPAGTTHALLIPGFLGTPKEMRPIGEELAAAGVSARAVLLPGFGPDYDRVGTVRAEDWVRTAQEAWREVAAGAERAVLVGFSMGGAVATVVAARGPRPDAMILMAPHWRYADRRTVALPVVKRVVKSFPVFADADFSNPATRATFAEMMPDADLDDPAVQARLRREVRVPISVLEELRRVGVMAGAAAGRVDAPTTILQGFDDATSLPRYSRQLGVRLGGPLTVEEFPGGHMLVNPELPTWERVREAVLRHVLAAPAVARAAEPQPSAV